MGFGTYRRVLGIAAVRRILVLGTLIRIPLWAAGIVLTLHVVSHLDRSYAEAGLVEMVYAVCLAISSPWRGRRLDRLGLRRTVAPSIVVLAVVWSIAPWVGYLPLLALVAVGGLFMVPQFSIVRQVLIGATPDEHRTAVLSMDSVAVEVSFMVGPVLGVLAATSMPTPIALLLCEALSLAGGVALWVANPSLGSAGDHVGERHPVRSWMNVAVVGVLLVAVAATVTLTGADLSTVAALRAMHATTSIGWILAIWGVTSAIGGLVYGALSRHPPSYVLIALLALTTAPVALAPDRWTFAALLAISGFFCAPTITATVDDLSRAVPASSRGEAMGWHGSAMTLGSAGAAPLVGLAIDQGGWQAGPILVGVLGLVIAGVAFVLIGRAGLRTSATPQVAPVTDAEASPLSGPPA